MPLPPATAKFFFESESFTGKKLHFFLVFENTTQPSCNVQPQNLMLSERIFCTSSKTVRSRLLTYLSAQSRKHGNHRFQIPFDRQQMADYLNLDRSALSKELSRMKKRRDLRFSQKRICFKK